MLPYFIMVGVPALLSILLYLYRSHRWICLADVPEYYRDKSYQKVVDAFFVIWLILLLLRDESVGTDLQVYRYHFEHFSAMSVTEVAEYIFSTGLEPPYYIICKIVSFFTDNFQWIIIICALISVIPIWKLYREKGNSGFLVVALFLNIAPFTMYFSGLRQSMAMAFVTPCYYYCKDKDWLKFILTVLIACLFHRSAVILLFMYPVYHLKLKKQWHIVYLLPMIGLIYYFKGPIFGLLLVLLQTAFYDSYSITGNTGAYAVTLLLIVLLIYCYFIAKQDKLDEETVGLRNILLLCVFIQVFSGVHTLAMRMNYYYLLFVPLLIDRVMNAGFSKYRFLIWLSKTCMIIFFTIYYFYYAYTDVDILEVYPYVSVFKDF